MQLMSNRQEESKRLRKERTKRIVALAFGALSIVLFFLPYMQIIINNTMYNLSGLQLLTVAGIDVDGTIVAFPVLLRVAVVLGALLPAAGILLLLAKKPVFSGIAFGLGAITPLVSLIASGEIRSQILNLNVSSNRLFVNFLWTFAIILLGGLVAAVCALWTRGGEKLAESVFFAFACVSVGSVLFITIYMLLSGAPAIAEIGLGNFLFGTEWSGDAGKFGILPMILSSIIGTAGAILIGVPIGLLTAVFLSELSNSKVAGIVRPAVELLAGIPSVIYGFFGMLIIVPFIKQLFDGWKTLAGTPVSGASLLAVILVLAIMVLPTIVSTAETSMRAVPRAYREASLGLGATPIQTIFKVTIPAAKSGVLSGVILGVGRAIGETMAVIMVAGNIANMPDLLGSVRLLTTGIAIDMAYSSGLFRQALFGIGLVLFVFIMIVNISFMIISKRGVQVDADK